MIMKLDPATGLEFTKKIKAAKRLPKDEKNLKIALLQKDQKKIKKRSPKRSP